MAKAKYLVDTSTTQAALGKSTPSQNRKFMEATAGGEYFSSVYLRKEFVCRFIWDLINFASVMGQCSTIEEGMRYYSHGFSARDVKGEVFALSLVWRSARHATTPRKLAEEIAGQAFRLLRQFDRRLKARIPDRTGCQVGGTTLRVDFNQPFESLSQFHWDTSQEVQDCGINSFLKINDTRSDVSKLLADDRTKSVGVCERAQEIKDSGKSISCRACARIGDLVIAIEQPKSWALVHCDRNSFPSLCDRLGKKELYIDSVLALQHGLPGFVSRVGGKPPRPTDATGAVDEAAAKDDSEEAKTGQ